MDVKHVEGGGAPEIRLHIESLVLEGLPFTSADGPRLQAAMERELHALLAAPQAVPSALTRSGQAGSLHASPICVGAIPCRESFALQAARAIYEVLRAPVASGQTPERSRRSRE